MCGKSLPKLYHVLLFYASPRYIRDRATDVCGVLLLAHRQRWRNPSTPSLCRPQNCGGEFYGGTYDRSRLKRGPQRFPQGASCFEPAALRTEGKKHPSAAIAAIVLLCGHNLFPADFP